MIVRAVSLSVGAQQHASILSVLPWFLLNICFAILDLVLKCASSHPCFRFVFTYFLFQLLNVPALRVTVMAASESVSARQHAGIPICAVLVTVPVAVVQV